MAENHRVLLFPWLAHGHVFPFLQLAKILSQNNFRVYLCSTPVILDSIREAMKKSDFPVELVDLHLPESPQLLPQYHTTKNLPPHLMPTLSQAFQLSISSFSDIITTLQPDLLIYDAFQTWSAKMASSMGIPSVHFITSSSTAYTFFHHLYVHRNFATWPFPAIYLRDYEMMSLMNFSRERSSNLNETKDSAPFFGVLKLSCEIVLARSCRITEGKYVDYMSKLSMKKIVSVGPMVDENEISETSNFDILDFMAQKEASSTVYVSFGSENYLSKEQIQELAKGLELSKVNFIWVARSSTGNENSINEMLPQGFIEATKTRGMIVQKWAPQTAILAHQSIGAFICHCGWSSINESIYFSVPIIALPLKLDQPVNSRLVVELGVGVEIEHDHNGKFDGEALAEAIREVIVEEKGEKLRSRAAELSKKMKMEQEEAFSQVVEELSRICISNKKEH